MSKIYRSHFSVGFLTMKCKTDDTNIKSHEFEEDSFASQACLKWEEELLVSTFFKFSRDGNMWS